MFNIQNEIGYGEGRNPFVQNGCDAHIGAKIQLFLGPLLTAYGAYRMSKPKIDQGYLAALNQQLQPMRDAHAKFGELAAEYEDPNSEMNQRMRDEIRTKNLEGFMDIANRQRHMATGEFGTQMPMDRGVMTDAIGAALRNYSKAGSQRQDKATQLYGQQSNISNALSQAQSQNYLLAQQQAQFLPQFLAQTGMGMMKQGGFKNNWRAPWRT